MAELSTRAVRVQVNRGQLIEVLERIADHSSDDYIREHVRMVARSLRGSGLLFINGPAEDTAATQERKGS